MVTLRYGCARYGICYKCTYSFNWRKMHFNSSIPFQNLRLFICTHWYFVRNESTKIFLSYYTTAWKIFLFLWSIFFFFYSTRWNRTGCNTDHRVSENLWIWGSGGMSACGSFLRNIVTLLSFYLSFFFFVYLCDYFSLSVSPLAVNFVNRRQDARVCACIIITLTACDFFLRFNPCWLTYNACFEPFFPFSLCPISKKGQYYWALQLKIGRILSANTVFFTVAEY